MAFYNKNIADINYTGLTVAIKFYMLPFKYLFAARVISGETQQHMQGKPNRMDRSREAATRWLPISSVGAAITFVITFAMQLPVQQVITATALTGALIFSGLVLRSYGK